MPYGDWSALAIQVRSLEIDCWDGLQGDPVVTHGRTLCTKVPFAAVAKAIGETAFIASPFPIFLSLEMHCNPKQQVRGN